MRSSRAAARVAVFFGARAVLAIPAGVLASRYVSGLTLLESLWGSVPAAGVLGVIALAASRRGRLNPARRPSPQRGPRPPAGGAAAPAPPAARRAPSGGGCGGAKELVGRGLKGALFGEGVF